MGISVVQAGVLAAGLLAGSVGAAAPAAAQYYGYGDGYGYRPYVVPYYRPRVLFVPPPVYLPPPVYVAPVGVAPRVMRRQRVARVRAAPAPVCGLPVESAFSGAGLQGGVVPASVPAATPFVAPVPGLPRLRPGVGDLPREPAGAPPPASVPPNNVYPPESGPGFRGD